MDHVQLAQSIWSEVRTMEILLGILISICNKIVLLNPISFSAEMKLKIK